MDTLFVVDALDENDDEVTLRFSISKYFDGNAYEPRLDKAGLIEVSPNDGSVLGIFKSPSVGDVQLANADGALDYLDDYAFDGRSATLSAVDGESVTVLFSGTVGNVSDSGTNKVFQLKSRQESLSDNHPSTTYAGDNTPPAGLEGTDDDIKGKIKPRVYGDCRNITPDLVNDQLLIYLASDRPDCIITAVYDDGVKLVACRTASAHSLGATTITLDNDGDDIPAGASVVFGNHDTVYTVDTGLTSSTIVLASGLTANVGKGVALQRVGFYTSSTDIQATDYFVSGDQAAGTADIQITGGVGAIDVGDRVSFAGHRAIYTVAVALYGGQITISGTLGLLADVVEGEAVSVIGREDAFLWGSYQGYFRLTSKPVGAITCDAMSVNSSGVVHKAGDVFAMIADEASISVDDLSDFNTAGKIGLFVGDTTSTKELFDRVVRSVAGYYWFVGDVCYLGLLTTPKTTADWTIEDHQIKDISRPAKGLGSNGLAIWQVLAKYDRIETVQTTVAGSVASSLRERLKAQTRDKSIPDDTVKTRNPSSKTLEIETLLRKLSEVIVCFTRLFNLVKTRRDIVDLILDIAQVESLAMGCTVRVITPRYGYSVGRNFLLLGYGINQDQHLITLRLVG